MALRVLRLSPLYRARPHPYLVLMWWGAEPDPGSPLGPGSGVGLHQLLDAVFPHDTGTHRGADVLGFALELTSALDGWS